MAPGTRVTFRHHGLPTATGTVVDEPADTSLCPREPGMVAAATEIVYVRWDGTDRRTWMEGADFLDTLTDQQGAAA